MEQIVEQLQPCRTRVFVGLERDALLLDLEAVQQWVVQSPFRIPRPTLESVIQVCVTPRCDPSTKNREVES
jgi:hypothetical protein